MPFNTTVHIVLSRSQFSRAKNTKFYPYTKIGILDILTKLYIIYAYIPIPDTDTI